MLVFEAIPRYRLPMEAFLILFVANGITYAYQRKRFTTAVLVWGNTALFLTFRYVDSGWPFNYL